jgi:hypothetical protein
MRGSHGFAHFLSGVCETAISIDYYAETNEPRLQRQAIGFRQSNLAEGVSFVVGGVDSQA